MLLDIFDPKAPPKAIGIDLGTTHSIVAHVRDDRPTALVCCDGAALLPSVVHYGRHREVIVGRAAQSFASREPERTIASAKRLMGRGPDDPQTRRLSTHRFTAAGDGKQVAFDIDGQAITPTEVSAEILKSLKQSAVEQLQAVGGAVITVPAYFDDAQRQATRDAGRLAGLEVLRLLNEPTAAALAYGLEKRQDGLFAVYDLGGGTFDVTVLRLDDGVFQVKSTGGDSALGGDDMDRTLAERFLPVMGFDAATAPAEIVAIVLHTARECKHQLSERTEVELELPVKGGGTTRTRVTRAELETLIEPLLERTGRSCRRALRDAEVTADEIDGVILVGGATRVPHVQAYVERLFGKPPLADIDPELVVAYGAALQAEMLATASDEVLLLDVLPLSLGVETMGGGIARILPRNTTIPVGAKSTFTTYADNQTGFEIHVVQGERELAHDCRSLAKFTLKGIPPMPAGHARLEVEFRADENGILKVQARELTTGVEQEVEVKPSYGLSDDLVEQMLVDALDHGEEDFEAGRLASARVEAGRVLLATKKALDTDADLLQPDEQRRIMGCFEQLQQAVSTSNKTSAIETRLTELEHLTRAWAGRRMDRAIAAAVAGKSLGEIADSVSQAAGVEAHVEAHTTGKELPRRGQAKSESTAKGEHS